MRTSSRHQSGALPVCAHCVVSLLPLLHCVGKGGFGKVNAITKKDTGELMALKRMEKFAVLQSHAHLKMVWVERKIMSLQSSPFLCNLLYAFQSSDEVRQHRTHCSRRGASSLLTLPTDVSASGTLRVVVCAAAVHGDAFHAGRRPALSPARAWPSARSESPQRSAGRRIHTTQAIAAC